VPNTKISALTAGNPALGTDQIPIARSGANFQVTAASIAALSPAGTVTSVGASGGTTGLTFSGGPITTSGTFTAGGVLNAANGGTGISSYFVGDLLYASSTSTLSPLPDAATGNALISGGVSAPPSYGKIGLTTHVSGTLPPGSGGTGAIGTPSNGQLLIGNGTNYSVANLTAGSNVTITNSAGGITIAAASGVTTFSAGTTGFSPNTATAGAVTLSGTLALVNGGTGQTTKAAAFNALSPITTTGDLILGNGTNSSTRLAIGANSYVLTSNGTTASWQAAGGGGGVTSFSAGSTGFSPSSSTTGAVTLSGTLNTGNGGTGTSTTPSNGQLLIGNGSGYTVANLTAGSGVTITNGSGSITIAAAAAGGPTISQMNLSTSSGSFSNNVPSSTYSKPLVGYTAVSPSNYGAFFFKTFGSGYTASTGNMNSMTITPSTGSPTSYTSGSDFSSVLGSFYVQDDILACYGLIIYNAALQTLFSDSSAAITSPSLKPLDAQSGFNVTNPQVNVSTSALNYNNQAGLKGAVVSKSGSTYILEFGSNSTTFDNSNQATSMFFGINNVFTATFTSYIDFVPSYTENSALGRFKVEMTVSNATLQTLLNNSFLS